MKIAKETPENWEMIMKFACSLDNELHSFRSDGWTDEQLGKWVRENAPQSGLSRVVFGYDVMVKNCCDPKADTLEWSPTVVKGFDLLRDLARLSEKLNTRQHAGNPIPSEDWSEMFRLTNEIKGLLPELPLSEES